MPVHPGTGRMGINLDEQLSDHLSAQSFTALSQVERGAGGAGFAGQSSHKTKLRVTVFGGDVHGKLSITSELPGTKGFGEGSRRLLCG